MDGITELSEALHGNSMRIDHLDELYVCRCPGLVSIPNHVDDLLVRDCPSLSLSLQSCVIKRLHVEQCKNLEYPTSDSCNPYLESLTIRSCGDSIEGFPLCSFSKLEHLSIRNWETPKLFKFPNGYHESFQALKSLRIYDCNNILSFPEGGLLAPNLRKFDIVDCKKLKSLPERMHIQLSSLEHVGIIRCPEIECFPEGGLPSSLKSLHILNWQKLMFFQTNWDWQRLTSLTTLTISPFDNNVFPEEVLLPSNLKNLTISAFPYLESLNHKFHLSSLQSLSIWNCLNLESLNGLQYMPFPSISSDQQLPKSEMLSGGEISVLPLKSTNNGLQKSGVITS